MADEDDAAVQPLELAEPDPVATAQRKYGKGAASLIAAGMFGLDKVLNDKKKTESVQVQEASSDPIDVDEDGISLEVDEQTAVAAPALERKPPLVGARRRPRRQRNR